MTALIASLQQRFDPYWRRYQHWWPATFFFLGIIFDILTLGRIDDIFNIVQQGTYLCIIGGLLICELLDGLQRLRLPLRFQPYWKYHKLITHFFFGSLLSSYTLFYFKSASLFSSFSFFTLLIGLLVINEFERFQKLGMMVKFALLTLCLASYMTYLVPILYASIGAFPFLLSLAATALIIYAVARWLERRLQATQLLRRQLLLPAGIVIAAFLGLYLIQAIPPVPLSLQELGIYHGVDKVDGAFHLTSQRPWWRFWQSGEQPFMARPGDKLYCFARIFSPARFNDQIFVRWLLRLKNGKWQSADAIPMQISGGRDDGWRAYSYKENWQPGHWRVQIESSDGREIGRLSFDVIDDHETQERAFRVEVR